MINIPITIELPDGKTPAVIKPIFDIHIGHRYTDEKKFKDDVRKIELNDNWYWLGGGDYLECFNRKFKNHRASDEADFCYGKDDIIRQQLIRFSDIVKPIEKKCKGLLVGNHELNHIKYHERNIMENLFDIHPMFKSKFVGYEGFVTIGFMVSGKVRMKLKIYMNHGYGGGKLQGGMANALERIFMWYDCNIGLMGHTHRRFDIENVKESPCGKSTKRIVGGAAFCGTYRAERDGTGYESVAGYPPIISGGYTIEVYPRDNYARFVKDMV